MYSSHTALSKQGSRLKSRSSRLKKRGASLQNGENLSQRDLSQRDLPHPVWSPSAQAAHARQAAQACRTLASVVPSSAMAFPPVARRIAVGCHGLWQHPRRPRSRSVTDLPQVHPASCLCTAVTACYLSTNNTRARAASAAIMPREGCPFCSAF